MILGEKTFAFWWFRISKGINFREIDQKTRKTRKFLPAKVSALKVKSKKHVRNVITEMENSRLPGADEPRQDVFYGAPMAYFDAPPSTTVPPKTSVHIMDRVSNAEAMVVGKWRFPSWSIDCISVACRRWRGTDCFHGKCIKYEDNQEVKEEEAGDIELLHLEEEIKIHLTCMNIYISWYKEPSFVAFRPQIKLFESFLWGGRVLEKKWT